MLELVSTIKAMDSVESQNDAWEKIFGEIGYFENSLQNCK